VQLAGIPLLFRPWPDTGDAPPLVVGVELELQPDRILDAAHETHARVGLLFHNDASLCRRIIASGVDSGKLRWPEACLVVACNSVSDRVGHQRICARQAAEPVFLTHHHSLSTLL
jgi:hypothetical protein